MDPIRLRRASGFIPPLTSQTAHTRTGDAASTGSREPGEITGSGNSAATAIVVGTATLGAVPWPEPAR